MKVIAIDPGSEQSALVVWDGIRISRAVIDSNINIISYLRSNTEADSFAIEMIASYGMPVGKTVFETCVWIGRFIQAWGKPYKQVYRIKVKNHLCHSSKAKDSHIRQALIDRFGAPGTKKEPGALYGLKKDLWAAFAVGVCYYDLHFGQQKYE